MRCPKMPRRWSALRNFFGYENRAAFAKDLLGHLNIVQGHYGKLFEGDPAGTAKLPEVDYGAGPDDPRLLDHLATLGFKKPVAVAGTLQQWMQGDYRALRNEATQGRLHRIRARPDRRPGACRRAR